VPEPKLLIVFDEQIRAHRLLDSRHQRRRLAFQHLGQQTSREPVRQHRGHPHHLGSSARKMVQPLLHAGAQTSRKRVPADHRATAADSETPLLSQASDQFADKERISMCLGSEIQQRFIHIRAHSVLDHIGDCVRRHSGDPHNCGVRALQHRQCLLHRGAASSGTRGQYPKHWHIRLRGGQRPQRQQRPVIGPVDIFERNRQRVLDRRRINRVLKVVDYPIVQIGRSTLAAQGFRIANRGSARRVAMNSEKNGTVC
jgi:hypothetical protein